MKEKSFIQGTIRMFIIQIVLVLILMLISIYNTYKINTDIAEDMLQNFTNIYQNEIENKITNANQLLQMLLYNNKEYDMLQDSDESERYYASISLNQQLQDSIVNDNCVDAIVIAEGQYSTCLDARTDKISASSHSEIRAFVADNTSKDQNVAMWDIVRLNDESYVYKMYVWNDKAVGAFIAIDNFMNMFGEDNIEDMSIFLTDDDGILFGKYGESEKQAIGEEIDIAINELSSLFMKFDIINSELSVHIYMPNTGFIAYIQSGMGILFVVIIILLFVLFVWLEYCKRNILEPMRHIKNNMEQIQEGDYSLRIAEEFKNSEFTILKNTFNKLMDEVMGLKLSSYEKMIELQEMELKSIRLQIKPHFFLNALATISSLSMRNKNQEIKEYIDALSKNIRYIFKSGLHTVTLSEEIQHIENYFKMQELKYPDSVFYYIDIIPEVLEWRIPQMIIHTIIENEYKHAFTVDESLMILIKIEKVKINEEDMLSISIEDDGKGYEEEFIHKFKDEEVYATEGCRIGLYSIRRMLELMYERKNLFEISNVEPHGCRNQFLIPAHVVHEVNHRSD